MQLSISAKSTRNTMLIIISVLAIAHIAQLFAYFIIADDEQFDFIELLDFDYEANLPSYYSALALLFCSGLLHLIYRAKRESEGAFLGHWRVLSYIFLFLSLDEATGLHEELGDFVEALEIFEASGMLYFAWVVPYAFLLLAFVVAYLKFLLHLPSKYRWYFIACGSLFIAGAVGFETVSAEEADLHGTETIRYSVLYTIEELCEMTAIAFFAHSLLSYMKSSIPNIALKIED